MAGRALIHRFVWAMMLTSGLLAVLFHGIWTDPKVWVPSLLFNLATTAAAVYVINLVVADLDNVRRKERTAARAERSKRREESRKWRRKAIAKEHVRSAFLCIDSANLITLKITGTSSERFFAEGPTRGSDGLAEALQTIVDISGTMRDYANAVNMQMIIYGRWLTSEELKYLELTRDSMLELVRVPAADMADDQKKEKIFHELVNAVVGTYQTAKAFGDEQQQKAAKELRDRVWGVRHAWGVPGLSRRKSNQENENRPESDSAGGTSDEAGTSPTT